MRQIHPTVYFNVWSSERFIFTQSQDWFYHIMTSVSGSHARTAEPAPVEWIGANLRKSLLSAEFKRFPAGTADLTIQQTMCAAKQQSDARWEELVNSLTRDFSYRNARATLAKAAVVTGWWQKDIQEGVFLYATNRKQGGYYEALANAGKKHADKTVQLSIDSSDEALGTAVRQMLAVSTISGKLQDWNISQPKTQKPVERC